MTRILATCLATCLISLSLAAETHQARFYRTFECIDNKCSRTSRPLSALEPTILKRNGQHTTLAACRLVCGTTGGLWPIPTNVITLGSSYMQVHPSKFNFVPSDGTILVRSLIAKISDIFVKNLQSTCKDEYSAIGAEVTITVNVSSPDVVLDWDTDESYSLDLATKENNVTVVIAAKTVFGARHGLETLSQLTAPITTTAGKVGLVLLDRATIADRPVYPHRGLLIDTSRNFLPIAYILRTIDGLASTKMNVLHWHATDSQSFPLEIKSTPLLAEYGAYSSDKIYSVDDMALVLNYAKLRGVRVILELDSPSHAGAGWDWGESAGLGKLAVCVDRQPWRNYCIQPPCGQLNPINPHTYNILGNIYKDVLKIWGTDSVLHLGGDEVFLPCWNSTDEITEAMTARGMGHSTEDFLLLWSEFHARQLKILDEKRGNDKVNVILWTSALTNPDVVERFIDKKRYVVQTWVEAWSSIPDQLLSLGYRLILSTKDAWYLDHGFWGNTKYHTWRDAYNNRIPRQSGVLGGEACLWGEYVDGGALDSRVWPRAAAVGERLWSDPTATTAEAEPRLQNHRERLKARGIYTEALSPEWCAQHDGQCQ